MNEETYRRWDITAKFIAPILTVAGILVGVWQFSTEQSAQLQRQRDQIATGDKLDFKRRIWEKQLAVYSRLSNVVGKIASARYKNNKEKFGKDIDEFYGIYWGDMVYVKDDRVEQAMIDFRLEIEDFLKGENSELNSESPEDRLKIKAKALIDACRASSKETWFTE